MKKLQMKQILNKLKNHFKKNYIIYFFALILIYFLSSYLYLVITNHNTFRTTGWDLGLYDQDVWNFSRFRNAISTVKPEQGGRMPALGDHLEFSLALLAPLYWIWNSPYCLLVFQVLCYIGGAIGLFCLARLKLRNKILTILVPVIFLAFEGTQRALDFDFHTLSLVALLLPWWFVVYEKKLFKYFWAIFILLLLVKLSFAILLVFVGIFFILRKDYKSGLIICVISSIYYYIGMYYLIPHFNFGQPFTHWDYKSITPDSSKFITTLIKNPHLIIENFTDSEIKTEFMTRAIYSGGAILLFFPEILVIIIPILMYKFLSDREFMWGLGFHFSIDFITFSSIGLIFAFHRIFSLIKSNLNFYFWPNLWNIYKSTKRRCSFTKNLFPKF